MPEIQQILRLERMLMPAYHRATLIVTLFACNLFAAKADWRVVNAVEPNPVAIFSLHARGDSLWAGSEGGVRISVDGGSTWLPTGSGMDTGRVVDVIPYQGHWLACQGRVLFLSKDGGRHWLGRDTCPSGRFSRVVTRLDTLIAWRHTTSALWPESMRYSVDGGETWRDYTADPGNQPGASVFKGDTFTVINTAANLTRKSSGGSEVVLSYRGLFSRAVATEKGLFAIAGNGVAFFSPDGRTGWRPVTEGLRHADIRGLAAEGAIVAIQTPLGISLSRDRGAHWTYLKQAFPAYQVPRLYLTRDHLLVWTRSAWLWRYSLEKEQWDSLPLPGTPGLNGLAAGGNQVVITGGSVGTGFYRSEDGGAHFEKSDSYSNSKDFLIAMDVDGSDLLYVGTDSSFRSADTGRIWRSAGAGCTGTFLQMAVTDSGSFLLAVSGLWREGGTANCGWTLLNGPPGDTLRPSLDPEGRNSHLAGAAGDLYLSTYAGLWAWGEAPKVVGTAFTRRKASSLRPRQQFDLFWMRSKTQQPGIGFDAKGAVRKNSPEE